eukprot:352338-Chlamydomonas_euryale.AAC.12
MPSRSRSSRVVACEAWHTWWRARHGCTHEGGHPPPIQPVACAALAPRACMTWTSATTSRKHSRPRAQGTNYPGHERTLSAAKP